MTVTKWNSGWPETICGKGSMMAETELIRLLLPDIARRYFINTVADVGCGDQNWVKHVKWNVQYDGYDIENHGPMFDMRKDILPKPYDLVMCIYVFNHLYETGAVEKAIKLLKKSGSKYLLATYNTVELFPLVPIESKWHKSKRSGDTVRDWWYGVFEL